MKKKNLKCCTGKKNNNYNTINSITKTEIKSFNN